MNILTSIKQAFVPVRKTTKCYTVKEFILYVADNKTVNDEYLKVCPKGKARVEGFCLPQKREMWVSYDENLKDRKGDHLPNLKTLGHELAHLPEIHGKDWHY